MRQIIFRAKRIKNGQWVFGDLVRRGTKDCYIWSKGHNKMVSCKIDPKTISQFTGLFDAKGNPIFEGDILQDPKCDTKHYVDYDEDQACFVVKQRYVSAPFYKEWVAKYGMVVIGNVHDNPVLFENIRYIYEDD